MRLRILGRLFFALGLGVPALCVPASAAAQGISTPLVGTGDSTAATADPAAVHFNPGMIAFEDRPRFLLGGNLIIGDINYRRDRRAIYQREDSFDFALPVDPESIDRSKIGPAEAVSATPIGGAPSLFGVIPIEDSDFTAGFGVYAPFGAVIDWPDDGPQRWRLQDATIAAIFFTPSIAYEIHERIRIGAGLSYVLGFAELKKVQDFAEVEEMGRALERPPINQSNDFGQDAPPGVRELEVMSRPFVLRQAFGHGITFNVGVGAEPVDGLRLGLTYQHRVAMEFNGEFELDMNDDFFTQDLAAQGLQFEPRVRGDATLAFPLPGSIRFAAAWEASDAIGLGLDAAYTFWSDVEEFDVRVRSDGLAQPELGLSDTQRIRLPRRWNDTIGVDGLIRVKPSDSLRLWVRGGYRSAASPDETIDAASPDGDRLVAGLGGSYRIDETYALTADALVQTTLRREVRGSDHDLGNGEYQMTLFALGLHLDVRL